MSERAEECEGRCMQRGLEGRGGNVAGGCVGRWKRRRGCCFSVFGMEQGLGFSLV